MKGELLQVYLSTVFAPKSRVDLADLSSPVWSCLKWPLDLETLRPRDLETLRPWDLETWRPFAPKSRVDLADLSSPVWSCYCYCQSHHDCLCQCILSTNIGLPFSSQLFRHCHCQSQCHYACHCRCHFLFHYQPNHLLVFKLPSSPALSLLVLLMLLTLFSQWRKGTCLPSNFQTVLLLPSATSTNCTSKAPVRLPDLVLIKCSYNVSYVRKKIDGATTNF